MQFALCPTVMVTRYSSLYSPKPIMSSASSSSTTPEHQGSSSSSAPQSSANTSLASTSMASNLYNQMAGDNGTLPGINSPDQQRASSMGEAVALANANQGPPLRRTPGTHSMLPPSAPRAPAAATLSGFDSLARAAQSLHPSLPGLSNEDFAARRRAELASRAATNPTTILLQELNQDPTPAGLTGDVVRDKVAETIGPVRFIMDTPTPLFLADKAKEGDRNVLFFPKVLSSPGAITKYVYRLLDTYKESNPSPRPARCDGHGAV